MLAQLDDSLTDNGPKKSGPERLCVVTREVKPVDELLRFVAAPDGSVVPDLKRNLPGRGLWITATRDTLDRRCEAQILREGLQAGHSYRRGSGPQTDGLLERSALDALAIAGKAGQVVAGFSKVEAAIGRSQVLALLHAKDGRAGRRPQAECCAASAFRRGSRQYPDDFRLYVPAIGFGIGPGKCGTCSPARRPRKQQFHRPLSAHDAFSHRRARASRTAITHRREPQGTGSRMSETKTSWR